MGIQEIIFYFIIGAGGALTKDILHDNSFTLPKIQKDRIVLGFLGGTIVGGIVGILVDENPVNAFTAGFAGTSVIESLLNSNSKKKLAPFQPKQKEEMPRDETIPEMIQRIAKEKGVDPNLALRVAKCESSLNPKATNENENGTIDRGLFQINDYWHRGVTDEQAFDPVFSTKYFCDRVNKGKLSDWDATRNCWDID